MQTDSIKKNLIPERSEGWRRTNVLRVPAAIVIAGLLVAGAVYINQAKDKVEKEIPGILTSQQAAEKAINYINTNLLASGTAASLLNVSEVNGIYKFQIKVANQQYDSYVTKDGKLLFTEQGIDLDKEKNNPPEEVVKQKVTTIGNFSVSQDEVCKENEKPIVYFFGSNGCPHCLWEHPVFEKVANNFEGYISFHNNMDSNKDREVLAKYSDGGIPTLIFGCKYYRVGSGEQAGDEAESKNLTALFCKLTGEKPDAVCGPVKDLINQINE
jgi:thiol-disulfide isomerase/thioredoxin